MNLKDKVKKLVITIAVTLGIFVGLLAFVANYNNLRDAGQQNLLSLLAGLYWCGVTLGAVMGAYKILGWVVEGFGTEREEEEQVTFSDIVDLKCGCGRIAVVLAAIAAVCSGFFFGLIPFDQYQVAQNDLKLFESQQGMYKGKAYYDYMQRQRLEDNYWLNLHKGMLVGMCISMGIFGAAIGFCVVWFVYKFFERLIINFFGTEE
jgi:hypothetical protein